MEKIQSFKCIKVYKEAGYTLTEVLIMIGIFAILSSFAVTNLLRPQSKVSIDSTVNTLIADLRNQQLKAMVGDAESTGTASAYGIYVETTKYTVFKGSTYVSSDSSNFIVNMEPTISLSTTLPSSQIVFSRVNGEVSGFTSGSNTITIINSTTNTQKTITLNRYGVPAIN